MLAGGDLDDHPVHAAIGGPVHIAFGAPGKGKDLRAQLSLHNLLHRFLVGGGDGGHPRFDAVDPHLRQLFGNRQLVLPGENHPRLLLPVPEGHVMELEPV